MCISRLDSSRWTILCATVYEDKLVVCRKSKQSASIHVTLFLSSEQTKFCKLALPKFHAPPVADCVLFKPAESALSLASPPTPPPPSCLQYRPLLKLILPLRSTSAMFGESIEAQLFLELFQTDCSLSDSAVLLVCGPNGHVFHCNLRNVSKQTKCSHQSSKDVLLSSSQYEVFKPLYSLDQPVTAIHAVSFPKRREQLDPLLFCGEDRTLLGDTTPNSLIFVGQHGKVALCFADGSINESGSQKFAKFIEYNVPGPILSSRLVPGQCLVYTSLRSLHRICLRQSCFKEVEEHAPQLQLQRGPLLIPEASFKFPERVAISIHPSIIVDCEQVSDNVIGQDAAASEVEDIRLTVVALKGDLSTLKVKVCGVEAVSRDPAMVAKEIKQCLSSIQRTSEEISSTSNAISKVNASLAELNDVLTLLCTVKQLREEDAPAVSSRELRSQVECVVSAGFLEVGVSQRTMCIDVELSYHGQRPLGSGWSLLVQVSPSSQTYHNDHLQSTHCTKHTGVAESGSFFTTPTTLSRSVPLEGLHPKQTVKERVSVLPTNGRTLCFSVSCYLHYDASKLIALLNCNNNPGLASQSCDHTVSVLLRSRLVDALDFTRPPLVVARQLHCPLTLATSCLNSDDRSSPMRNIQGSGGGLVHSLQLPIKNKLLPFHQSQRGREDQPNVYKQLSLLLLPHIEGVEEEFRNGSEIRLTAYDGSGITFRLVMKQQEKYVGIQQAEMSGDSGLSLAIECSSRLQLAEIVWCVHHRLQQNSGDDGFSSACPSVTEEELYRREAELKGVAREAVSLLDEVTMLERFSREPLAAKKVELNSKTFALYSRLRELQH